MRGELERVEPDTAHPNSAPHRGSLWARHSCRSCPLEIDLHRRALLLSWFCHVEVELCFGDLEVTVQDCSFQSFDEEAVLVKCNGRQRPVTRRAALGLLLNRVKRMRISPGMTIKIVCGEAVYCKEDIARLLESHAYQDWLSNPRRPQLLQTGRRLMPRALR